MPVEFYFQVVGSGIDREEAEKLCAEDKRMGKRFSTPEQRYSLSESH